MDLGAPVPRRPNGLLVPALEFIAGGKAGVFVNPICFTVCDDRAWLLSTSWVGKIKDETMFKIQDSLGDPCLERAIMDALWGWW